MPPKRKAVATTNIEPEEVNAITSEMVLEAVNKMTSNSDPVQVSTSNLPENLMSAPAVAIDEAPKTQCTENTNDCCTSSNLQKAGSNTVIGVFTRLTQTSEHDMVSLNAHIPELLVLLQAIENDNTPLLWRVKFLSFLLRAIVVIKEYNTVKKIFTSLVKFIASNTECSTSTVSTITTTNNNNHIDNNSINYNNPDRQTIDHVNDSTQVSTTNTNSAAIMDDKNNKVNETINVITNAHLPPQLINGAIECIVALGSISTDDKRWETFAREGADILLQVQMDRDYFSEETRQCANKALDILASHSFKAVVTKLLHWMSDDREDDEVDHLARERECAINRLSRLVFATSMRANWTVEMQQHVFALLPRVLATVDSVEFAHLSRIVCRLPMCQEEGCVPFIECILAAKPLESVKHHTKSHSHNSTSEITDCENTHAHATHTHDRTLESLSFLLPHINHSTSAEFDLVTPLQEAGLLTASCDEMNGTTAMHLARVMLIASRLATSSAAEIILPYITAWLEKIIAHSGNNQTNSEEHAATEQITSSTANNSNTSGEVLIGDKSDNTSNINSNNNTLCLSASPTVIELLLLCMVSLSKKQTVEVLQQLHKEEFVAKMKHMYEIVGDIYKLVSFALKKNDQRGCTERRDVLGHASLQNIKLITSSFMCKHIPLGEITESYNVKWISAGNKRSRNAATTSRLSQKRSVRENSITANKNVNDTNTSNNAKTNFSTLPPVAGTREYYERHRTSSNTRQIRTNSNNNNNNNKNKNFNRNTFKNNTTVANSQRKSVNARRNQRDNTRRRW